jgi:hypothetical protein
LPVLQVPEVPLVVSDAAESITKTSKALELLKALGADADTDKARDSKALRRWAAGCRSGSKGSSSSRQRGNWAGTSSSSSKAARVLAAR